jgi:hypothetical protein
MLERMIIDISKWIVIILIFFIAFACSLYLIFSYFAVALEQQKLLKDPTNNTESGVILSKIHNSSMIEENSRCPRYFYELVNQSITNQIEDEKENTLDNKSFCEKASEYDKIKRVGPHPAVYYFGVSFGSTILTTFFTLFGVIVEDSIPDRGYELVTLTCNKPNPINYAPGFDVFTSNLGFIIFGLFTFICVTVLINTLIAMMEETIDTIDDRADVEWKFARSRLYMEYIRDGKNTFHPFFCRLQKVM